MFRRIIRKVIMVLHYKVYNGTFGKTIERINRFVFVFFIDLFPKYSLLILLSWFKITRISIFIYLKLFEEQVLFHSKHKKKLRSVATAIAFCRETQGRLWATLMKSMPQVSYPLSFSLSLSLSLSYAHFGKMDREITVCEIRNHRILAITVVHRFFCFL